MNYIFDNAGVDALQHLVLALPPQELTNLLDDVPPDCTVAKSIFNITKI